MNDKSLKILKASAGSGKTFQLTLEYLTLVLENPDKFSSILAITFTNKAAAEMKKRILETLFEFKNSSLDDLSTNKYVENIKNKIKISTIEIKNKSNIILSNILHNYSNFAITTIDSFFYSIFRTFALDLGYTTQISTELEVNNVIQKAVNTLITEVGIKSNITNLLQEFVKFQIGEEKKVNVDDEIVKFASVLTNEESFPFIEKLAETNIEDYHEISIVLKNKIRGFEKELLKYNIEFINLLQKSNINKSDFAYGEKGLPSYFKKIENRDFKDFNLSTRIDEAIKNPAKCYKKDAPIDIKNRIDSIHNDLVNLILKSFQYFEENYKTYKFYKILFNNIYNIGVLNEVLKILNIYKTEKNIVFLSEVNQKIYETSITHDANFLYERVGTKFQHLMIDEFQDTSVIQWHNILHLIINSLSEKKLNLIVGDGKQSIYRWRNGEVEQFVMLPDIYNPYNVDLLKEYELKLHDEADIQNLSNNYRSMSNVIYFNNDFFEYCISQSNQNNFDNEENAILQKIYENHKQNFQRRTDGSNEGGFVGVKLFNKKESKDENITEENNNKAENFDEFVKVNILNTIKDLTLNYNYELKDIALLFRKNNIASEVAEYLTTNGIEVISSESLLLKKSPQIQALVSLIEYIWTDNKDISMLNFVQNYRKINSLLKDKNLHECVEDIIKNHENDIIKWLKQFNIEINADLLKSKNIYSSCEILINTLGINKSENAFIVFFLDFVHKFENDNPCNYKEFIAKWHDKKDSLSVVIPEGVNAVKVMTIHKSKGLEFPVVIYTYTQDIRLTKENLWVNNTENEFEDKIKAMYCNTSELKDTIHESQYQKESLKTLYDSINVSYVAFTRAVEKLYVLADLQNKKSERFHLGDMISKFPLEINNLENSNCEISYYKSDSNSKEDEKYKEFNYYIGKLEYKKSKEKEIIKNNSILYKELISEPLQSKNIKLTSQLKRNLNEETEKLRNQGILIHDALKNINNIEDIETIVNKMYIEFKINEIEKQELIEKLKEFIENSNIKVFFNNEFNVRNEAEIIVPDKFSQNFKNKQKLFRPDKILESQNELILIDFKTGQNSDKYISQIELYANIIQQIIPKPIKKYLIFIENCNVIEIK